jgi:short-subunit dehydrogenase
MTLSGRKKHVVITGASSGIGAAMVKEWAGAGAAVTLVARRKAELEAVAAAAGGSTQIFTADLTDPEKAIDFLPAAEKGFGPIDVLVNNAGVQIVEEFVLTEPERAELMLRLDLHTPLRLSREVVPGMIARGSGCVVDVSSVAALAPTPIMTYYNAAKAGLAAASESLRGELRGTGVHVVTVYPGPVKTGMADAALQVLEPTAGARHAPTGTPERLARLVRRAVEQRKNRVIYPGVYGITSHFPNLTRFMLDRLSPRKRTSR